MANGESNESHKMAEQDVQFGDELEEGEVPATDDVDMEKPTDADQVCTNQ